MSTLFIIQLLSCTMVTMLALMLAVSRFQIRWIHPRYETSRWLIFASMLFLAIHYVLQMTFDIRSKSDMSGAVVNVLFYTPVSITVSYAIFNVICFREGRRQYKIVGFGSYAFILLVFLIGFIKYRSLNIGSLTYVMIALCVLSMLYCFVTTGREIRHHRKIIEKESSADLLPYDQYTWSCYALLTAAAVLILTTAIVYRPLLLIIFPLMLIALFIFIMSFIGYGFNMVPVDIAMQEEAPSIETAENAIKAEDTNEDGCLSETRATEIATKLKLWCETGGFRDSSINMSTLSSRISVPRNELSRYFERYLKSSFRTWLSDIRFQEAQRMLLERPHFNNDAISSECGFSSHAHLYKVFKMKTGMTPGQWKEKVFHS